MKKIAFFVEGLTEQTFVCKLLNELFGSKNISITKSKIIGGTKIKKQIIIIESAAETDSTKFFVIIFDCSGDGAIKSNILDRRESLIASGYSKIFGLRDVYPDFKKNEVTKVQQNLYFRVPQKDVTITFILSIMEIESWFIAEQNHFTSLDPKLTCDYIVENFGINPEKCDVESIERPAELLNDIYQTVGKSYTYKNKKNKLKIERTIDCIDYYNLCFTVPTRVESLKLFLQELDAVFT